MVGHRAAALNTKMRIQTSSMVVKETFTPNYCRVGERKEENRLKLQLTHKKK